MKNNVYKYGTVFLTVIIMAYFVSGFMISEVNVIDVDEVVHVENPDHHDGTEHSAACSRYVDNDGDDYCDKPDPACPLSVANKVV